MKTINENLENLIVIAEDAIYEGDYKQAEKLLFSALEDEPGYAKLHYTLAWMNNYYKYNVTEAEKFYSWALFFEPKYDQAFKDLAYLLLHNRKYDKLKDLMLRMKKNENPDLEFIFGMLGKTSEAQGEYREAMNFYRKALMNSLNADASAEIKQNMKRTRFKRLKTIFRNGNQ